MTEPTRFSVLIAAYNADRFIAGTLDTVRRQTYRHFEVVVVDDGSSDGTAAAVTQYRQAHPDVEIRLIRSANRGMGGARNLGVREARYDWVAFLDHDDLWYPEKLERVAEAIRADPAVDIIHHDEHLVERTTTGEMRVRRTLHYRMPTDALYERMLFGGRSLSGSATVVRKGRVVEAGWFSECRDWAGIEDYDLWLKLAAASCRIRFIDEVLGEYIVHEANTTRHVVAFHERLFRVLDHHFAEWPQRSPYTRYRMRRRRAESLRGAGHQLTRQGDLRTARAYLASAFALDPLSWKTVLLMGFVAAKQISRAGRT